VKLKPLLDARCRLFLIFLTLSISAQGQAGVPVFFAESREGVCRIDRIETPNQLLPFRGEDHSRFPIQLEADEIDSSASGMLSLVGDASAVQGAQAVYADSIAFSREEQIVEASGNVVMHSTKGDRITANSLQLDLDTQIGYADKVFFQKAGLEPSVEGCRHDECLTKNGVAQSIVEPHASMRGYAERVYFDGHDRERFEDVELSRCVEGNNSVILAASQIVLDHSIGEATGRNLKVRFFDIPIFYFPILTFPITDDRKTGFLSPSVGLGGEYGFRLVVPYYLNISPDQDATIVTDFMAERGTLLRGEYRYIGMTQAGKFSGRVGAEIITLDRQFGSQRYGGSLFHEQQVSDHWHGQLDLGYVSDRDYLDDFGDTLEAESADHVPQSLKLEYDRTDQVLEGDIFNFGILFSDFQIIDALIDEKDQPYARLPRVSLDWNSRLVGNLESDLEVVWTRFKHPSTSKSEGDRLNVQPSLIFNAEEEHGFLRPQLDLNLISYRMDRASFGRTQHPSLVVPVFSVDSGLAFERKIDWLDQPWLQTIEPRVFYAFTPYVYQDDQPIFDDEEFDLDSASKYFSPNRFHRSDRVGDTNRLSVGLESRLIESYTGKQRLGVGAAQMFYLSNRKIRKIFGDPPLTDRYSPLFGEIDANLTDKLSTSADIVWSWNDRQISLSDINLNYENDWNRLALSYRFETGDAKEELFAELVWPFSRHWLFGIETLYSIQESANLYTGFSVGYDACCWATQFELSHNREEENNVWIGATEIVFKLQLKDLGGISSSDVEGIISDIGFD